MSDYLSYRLGLKNGKIEKEKKKAKPIKHRSKKLEDQMKEYRKIVKEMLDENDRCELKTPVCTGKAQGLQHTKRRGENLLVRKYLKRSCNPCNLYCEEHPQYALDNGLAISKFKKEVA